MMEKLPFLISIPHGGDEIPHELRKAVCLSREDLFDDSDAFSIPIYDVGDMVQKVVIQKVARAFVDMNRPPNRRPPDYSDGVIKLETCLGKRIYTENGRPDSELISTLLERYYYPYHHTLSRYAQRSNAVLGLDCHTMLPRGPKTASDYGENRPLVNLGNLNGHSCSNRLVKNLAASFQQIFNFSDEEVSVNYPFQGGYITQRHACNPLPWIQIELNKSLYLKEPWFQYEKRRIDRARLVQLNALFRKVLLDFNKTI